MQARQQLSAYLQNYVTISSAEIVESSFFAVLFGYLRYPEAEKFDEYENLFAIRIVTSGNERFFYCYDDGEMVIVLHSFAKRTKKTPRAELQKALRIRKELLGE